MENLLEKATRVVKENKEKINNRYRHKFHFMSESGWINDPNGLVEYNGVFNLYYQFNPYESHWNTMYWGHATTTDFIRWKYEKIAMTPDTKGVDDGGGCFSGSSIIVDGTLYIFYSGVSTSQDVCLATSKDGINFHKYEGNPIVRFPNTVTSKDDFRDPYIFKKDDKYYFVIGVHEEKGGTCYLYESYDLYNWKYLNKLFDPEKITCDQVFECPSYHVIDGKEFIFGSIQGESKVLVLEGNMDFENFVFNITSMSLADYGMDFYAPSLIKLKDSRYLIFAWMKPYEDRYIPNELGHYWCGSHIVPREVTYKNSKLCYLPVKELNNYKKLSYEKESILVKNEEKIYSSDSFELDFKIKRNESSKNGFMLFKDGDSFFKCNYDGKLNKISIDKSSSSYSKDSSSKEITLDRDADYVSFKVLVDVSSIEIFINDGEYALTSLFYKEKSNDVVLYGDNTLFESVKIYDIEV